MSKTALNTFCLALISCFITSVAQAGNLVSEVEPNNPLSAPQTLVANGGVSVNSYLGNNGSNDLDYFTFYANAGDVITADIDNGIGGTKSVDTVMAIFDSTSAHNILRFDDDATSVDPGSVDVRDARIDNFVVPATGYYIVGVSNYPRYFMDGGDVTNPTAGAQGDYTLVISGVTTAVKQIAIEIKPGQHGVVPINPRSRGKIPVAILGGPDFNALTVDTRTLTFGSTGNEHSLSKCGYQGVDVNGDGRVDLLCHFDNQKANFKVTDAEAKVKGRTTDGKEFEGTGYLKVIPEKR